MERIKFFPFFRWLVLQLFQEIYFFTQTFHLMAYGFLKAGSFWQMGRGEENLFSKRCLPCRTIQQQPRNYFNARRMFNAALSMVLRSFSFSQRKFSFVTDETTFRTASSLIFCRRAADALSEDAIFFLSMTRYS